MLVARGREKGAGKREGAEGEGQTQTDPEERKKLPKDPTKFRGKKGWEVGEP